MQSEFLVEHTRLELVTPTLPVLCAPNCANAPFGYPSIIPHFPGFVKSFLEKVLTDRYFLHFCCVFAGSNRRKKPAKQEKSQKGIDI